MHKFRIDSSIVEEFLKGSNLKQYQTDEIYIIGTEEEQNIFTMPINPNYDRITLLMKRLNAVLKYFALPNEEKYRSFIQNYDMLEENIIIKLVVGMPVQFKKLFRMDSKGQNNIIIDLANYTLYSDDYDEIIEDIEDYLGYALTLLVLDTKESSKVKTSINTFEHALYCASFANYISESDQLNFMRNLKMLDMWIFLEYDALRKVVKKKKHSSRYALEYLDMALVSNPEMITLGVTGKVFLEDKTFDEAKSLFNHGARNFLKEISKDRDLLFASRMTKTLSVVKTIIIPLVIIWIVTTVVSFIQGFMNIPFKIFPLIIMFLLTLQEALKYKLSYISFMSFFIKTIGYLLSSVVFCIIVR